MRSESLEHRGFSLLEVLIAIVILSIGLLAVAALQGRLLKNTSDTKARTTAMQLAEWQMDRFRSISQIGTEAGVLAFDDIESGSYTADSGGFGGATVDVSEGAVDYTMNWVVTDCYFDDGAPTCVAPAGDTTVDFKRVVINVGWEDTEATQTVMIEEIIPRVTPDQGGRVASDNDISSARPLVPYTPLEAPEVVSVPTFGGGSRLKQTTEPAPEVQRQDNSTVTAFSTITFDLDDEGAASVVRQEDTFVVSCTCAYSTPSDNLKGRLPTIWNGRRFVTGEEVDNKPVGVPVDGAEGGEPQLCVTCCRDHHDVSGQELVYDPFRVDDRDATTGNHNHYRLEEQQRNGMTVHEHVLASPIADSEAERTYGEVCRFTRVDGDFFVTQDFELSAYNVLPAAQVNSQIQDYQDYVIDFVTWYLNNLPDDYPASVPTQQEAEETGGISFPASSLTSADFSETDPVNGNTGAQLSARGVYIDFLNADLLECLATRRMAVGSDVPNDTPTACMPDPENFLDIVPFFEVNVSGLARWQSTDPSVVSVTQEAIPQDQGGANDGGDSFDEYSRGFASIVGDLLTSVDVIVSAAIEQSNSGFTDTDTTDPADDVTVIDDVDVLSGQFEDGRIVVNVAITKDYNGQPSLSDITLTDAVSVRDDGNCEAGGNRTTSSASCTAGASDGSYTCYLEPDEGRRLAFAITGFSQTKNNGTIVDRELCVSNADSLTFRGCETGSGVTDTTTIDFGTLASPVDGGAGEYNLSLSATSDRTDCF